MKRKVLIILLIFCIQPVFAESWDDFNGLDRMWDGQKSITNKEFEQVMDALDEKKHQKEKKQRKKLIKKIGGGGTSLHTELNPDKEINEIQPLKPKEEGLLINIPVNIYLDENPIEKGYYKVIAEKKDGKIFINFYQSQFFKGKIQAEETTDDFDEETLDFARIIPYNHSYLKLIFGSIDFNAYAFVPFSE